MATPSTIGRLRIERQLGAGGFATVWLAHDPELDSPVAVKILAENFATNADIRRRFIDEARLLRWVDSDHLVRVYDVGELPDGRPFFVMTFADRGTLADRLAQVPPPWPPASVVAVVDAVADGLAVLHRHGVVHRDIKPVNILLRTVPDDGERVLLGDLGIAKDLQWASGLTVPTGSGGYAAPEQEFYSETIGPPTDVHALAVTTGQLLGLRPPWPATPLGTALARATAPDPAVRTQTAHAFAAELRESLAAYGHGAPPHPSGAAPTAAPMPAPISVPPAAPPLPAARPAAPPPSAGPAAMQVVTPFPPGGTSPGLAPKHSRRLLPVAAGAAVVLVTGGGWAAWALTHAPQRLTPVKCQVSVEVPRDWSQRTNVSFPGHDDTNAGVRAGSGNRSVSIAFRTAVADPSDVLTPVQPEGCSPSDSRAVRVGAWDGRTESFTACPDGSRVDEVVLTGGGANGWTVWVEVRSASGAPALEDVLGSLEVSPS